MSQERETRAFRFDLIDAVVLMVVASALSFANGRPRVEPLRWSNTNGSMRIYLERSHVVGWPAPIYRWSPHEETGVWFPRGVAGNIAVALLLGAAALLARRAIALLIVGWKGRASSAEDG